MQRVIGVQHRPGVEVLVADRGGHVRVPAVHGIFRGGGGDADGYVGLDEQPEDIVPVFDRLLNIITGIGLDRGNQLVAVIVSICPGIAGRNVLFGDLVALGVIRVIVGPVRRRLIIDDRRGLRAVARRVVAVAGGAVAEELAGRIITVGGRGRGALLGVGLGTQVAGPVVGVGELIDDRTGRVAGRDARDVAVGVIQIRGRRHQVGARQVAVARFRVDQAQSVVGEIDAQLFAFASVFARDEPILHIVDGGLRAAEGIDHLRLVAMAEMSRVPAASPFSPFLSVVSRNSIFLHTTLIRQTPQISL